MTLFISIALSKADRSHEHLRIMNLTKNNITLEFLAC
jgi:hypothetical protein